MVQRGSIRCMSEGEKDPPALRLWRRVTQEQHVRGWNVGDLADRAGVGRNTISRLKTNRTPPLTKTVNALALTLGIPIKEAYELAGLDTPAEGGGQSLLEAHLSALLEQVPARRREQLERMAEDERDRYERLVQQAREDYERQVGRITQLARVEADADTDDK